MKTVKRNWAPITTLFIIVAAIMLRLYLYGDPRLSIGINDTQTYIDSSHAPILSWASFTGQRIFTMNLVYHIFVNNNNCQLSDISYPAARQENDLKLQSCFDKIAFLQNLLSMLSWSFLAWEMSNRVRTSLYKILIAIIILSFAISPQIAEWDAILGSEALTVSLFPICLALLIEMAFQLFEDQTSNKIIIYCLMSGWLIVLSLWMFVQDANVYFVLITPILLMPLIIKDRLKNKALLVASLFLIGIIALGLMSSAKSVRWQVTLEHSYEKFIFPYPSNINYIKELGAPDPNSAGFKEWFDKKAPSAYLLFLASHPRFVISNVLEYMPMFTADYSQPYFIGQNAKFSSFLLTLGDFFHPETSGVYLIDTLLLVSLCYMTVKKREVKIYIWAWIGIWVYISTAAMLFIRYFGDTYNVMRHLFPAVEFFRLLLWILLIVQADLLATRKIS